MSRAGPCSAAAPLQRTIRRRSICACRTSIRRAIEAGVLRPLDALPGERDIAEAFQVSRVTVRKALCRARRARPPGQRQGSGTFVAPPPQRVEQALSRLTSFTEDMRAARPRADGALARPRHLARLAARRRCVLVPVAERDGVPRERGCALPAACRWPSSAPPSRRASCPIPTLVDASLYDVLAARGSRPVRALQRLSRRQSRRRRMRALLDVPPGAAALAIDRLSFLDDGTAVEFTRSWYRGDAYDFVAELTLKRD